MKHRVLFVVLAVLLAASGAAAQQGTSEVRGRVLDPQGGVLPGVTVTVRNQDTGMFRETVSNADGTYFISGIVPGAYEITAEMQGFKKYARRDVRLEVGKTTSLDVEMEVGTLAETVTVSAESPIVDVTSKEVGGHITARELVELPSINRNFVGFVGLLPGIIPSISTESFGSDSITVNGQDPRNNNYMLDGANNNDDVIGQRAGTQARTPIEAVQEFQVITNQFDAEFGRTTGAIINAVTKSGTNNFRGSAFGFFQDASLTNKDYFAKKLRLDKPDTSQQQFGGTIGGPIVRDKAHFFGSVERVRIDEGITINIPARPEFNATTTEQTRVWNTVVRFDHQLSANHTWGVRWLREYSPQFNQIIGSVTLEASREEDDLDQTVVTSLNSVMGNTRVNSLRIGWTQEDVSFANPCFNGNGRIQSNCQPTLAFQTFTTQQSSVAQARINDAVQIEDTLSWFLPGKRGDHDLKFGVQGQYSQSKNDAQDNLNGTFSFGRSNGPFDANNPSTYPERFSIRVGGPGRSLNKSNFFAAFVQDKWKMTDRLTMSLGLRYDLEKIPIREVDNPLFADENDYPVDKNNIQPRIGLAYNLADGRSVVRGGYGRFFDKTHFELIGGIYTNTVFASSFNRNFPLADIDPNPRLGSLPTDPFLVGGPTLTDAKRALLEQQFGGGASLRNTGATWDSPDRRLPYTDQVTAGYERQFGGSYSASVDYVHAFARDLFISRQLNPQLRATTAVTSTAVRQGSAVLSEATQALRAKYGAGFAAFTGSVTIPENVARTDYDAVMFQLEKRFSNHFSTRLAYTLAYSRGNTTGVGIAASNFQVLDDLHLELNEGPTNLDQRHNFVISGTAVVPRTGGLTVSWIARALSGSPFTITNGNIDPDRNGTQAEPLPSGSYSGQGDDSYTVDFESKRNGAYGPGFFKLDLRLGYRVDLAGRRFELFGEIFNVTDRVNFANPSGNQASTDFLRLTTYSTSTTPRTGQFGVRFAF
ncbi:MAG: TonB-dependent receptor [Vicinamibacterales bacterium]